MKQFTSVSGPHQPSDATTPRASLDRMLVLLHDGGDAAAIRVCDELAIGVNAARRGTLSRRDLAFQSRTLAKSIGT
jgi:hypothetical protein